MTPVRIVQETAQSSPQARPALQAGSVVQARVVRNLGGGSYVISLAGRMVSVRSEQVLAQGAVFSAKIAVRGNQVVLSIVGQEGAKPLVTAFDSAALRDGMDANLAALLASLGLPPETEAFRLLQFAQAMGMRIDPRQMRKALQAAGRDGGGEDASQTALVLDEKGIEPNADALAAVTGGMAGGGRNGGNQPGGNGGDETGRGDEGGDCGDGDGIGVGDGGDGSGRKLSAVSESAGDFPLEPFLSASDIKEYFASVDEAALRNEVGALTLFNSLRGGEKAQDAAHWIVLPFEWNGGYSGKIRILPEKNQKKLRQIIINAKSIHTTWNFVVYCKQGKIDSVRFSRFPFPEGQDAGVLADGLKRMLLPLFGSLKSVDFVGELDGWCAQDMAVGTVGGLV